MENEKECELSMQEYEQISQNIFYFLQKDNFFYANAYNEYGGGQSHRASIVHTFRRQRTEFMIWQKCSIIFIFKNISVYVSQNLIQL